MTSLLSQTVEYHKKLKIFQLYSATKLKNLKYQVIPNFILRILCIFLIIFVNFMDVFCTRKIIQNFYFKQRSHQYYININYKVMINKKGVTVNFFTKWQVSFGKAVYLVGSVPELGEWTCDKGIRMIHAGDNHWIASVQMERHAGIEYKFFASKFEYVQWNDIHWQQGSNRLLNLETSLDFIFPNMSLCSFNIRLLTEKDEGPNHWDARKDKIYQFFDKNQYDFIGIQQATFSQRTYLQQLMEKYQYHGKKREHENEQECGIFIKKQKFQIIQENYQWNPLKKQQTLLGDIKQIYDQCFTQIVVAPRISSLHQAKIQCLLVINLHLNKISSIQRRNLVQRILDTCLQVRERFEKNKIYDLISCVIMGDFNESQYSSIIGILKDNKKMPFKSMRKIEGADQDITYNGFQNKYLLRLQAFIANSFLAIDHMFYWIKQDVDIVPAAFNVGKQKSGEYMSSHYPIIGRFKAEQKNYEDQYEESQKFEPKQKKQMRTKYQIK